MASGMDVTFVTSNRIKFGIARRTLSRYGIRLVQRRMGFLEPQTFSLDEVALEKARQAMRRIRGRFIVDDSGFQIAALKGFPGALTKDIHGLLGDECFMRLMRGVRNRRAMYVNVLVFGDSRTRETKLFHTVVKGKIATRPAGDRRIGWAIDRIFIPAGGRKTLAQLDDAEWEEFWDGFSRNMHYNRFGIWAERRYGRESGSAKPAPLGARNRKYIYMTRKHSISVR